MLKNSYLSVDSSYEEELVLQTLKEMPTIRNQQNRQDELFTNVLRKMSIEDRANIFLRCVFNGKVGISG